MKSLVTCPACGRHHTLHRLFDAWACHKIIGVDPNSELVVKQKPFTQVFDDNHIECLNCGEQFTDAEVVRHLHGEQSQIEDKNITYVPAGGFPFTVTLSSPE